jgi:hypothetical protein
MAIDPVTIDTTPALQPGPSQAVPKSTAPPPPQPHQDASTTGPRVSSDQVHLSGNSADKYQALQTKNEGSNATAGAIRNTDRTLEALGQKIDAMKVPLESIQKNFPPFSLQDAARRKLLMNYASLRKEIDQLTLPPPPEVVKARKAQALPDPLPVDATDSQIADHLANLDAVGAALNGSRAGLAADTAALVHDGRFSGIFSRVNGAQTAQTETSLSESGAAQKSAQVGRQFAAVVSQGVTANSSQFLKGLS